MFTYEQNGIVSADKNGKIALSADKDVSAKAQKTEIFSANMLCAHCFKPSNHLHK
jgi:hypothetical protein